MKMKIQYLLCILMSLALSPLSADMISQPAATVNLIRNTVITVEQLNEKIALYEQQAKSEGSTTAVVPLNILNIMVNDELVLQGAERDGYTITDDQIAKMVKQQKTYVEQQTGKAITDQQFEQVIKNTYGMDMAAFRKNLQDSALVDAYIRGSQSETVNDVQQPIDKDIQDFYRANRPEFINPELVRISHIYMAFDETNKATVRTEMDKIARWLKYNTYTFEELVPKYSQDKSSNTKGGDLGWLSYDDDAARKQLGEEFFNTAFELALGKTSGVVESPNGFHVVKVTIHNDPKMLGINDPIAPDSTTSVYQYIEKTLLSYNQQTAYLKAINNLIESLRKDALVEILYK